MNDFSGKIKMSKIGARSDRKPKMIEEMKKNYYVLPLRKKTYWNWFATESNLQGRVNLISLNG